MTGQGENDKDVFLSIWHNEKPYTKFSNIIEDSEDWINAVIDSSCDLLIIDDLHENNNIRVNENWGRILGHQPRSFEKSLEIMHPNDQELIIDVLNSINNREKKEVRNIEFRYETGIGEYLDFIFTFRVVRISGKEILISIGREIKKEKRGRLRKKQYRDHLERQVEERNAELLRELAKRKYTERLVEDIKGKMEEENLQKLKKPAESLLTFILT